MVLIGGLILFPGIAHSFSVVNLLSFGNPTQPFSPAPSMVAPGRGVTLYLQANPLLRADSSPQPIIPAWDDEGGWKTFAGIQGLVELLLTDVNSWTYFNKREFVNWEKVSGRFIPYMEKLLGINLSNSEKYLFNKAWDEIVRNSLLNSNYPQLSEIITAPEKWEEEIQKIVKDLPREINWPKNMEDVLKDFASHVKALVGRDMDLSVGNDRTLVGLWALVLAQRIKSLVKNNPNLVAGIDYSYEIDKKIVLGYLSRAIELKEGIKNYIISRYGSAYGVEKITPENINPQIMLSFIYWGKFWGRSPWMLDPSAQEIRIVDETLRLFSLIQNEWLEKEPTLRDSFIKEFLDGKAVIKFNLDRNEDIGRLFAFLSPLRWKARTPEEEEQMFEHLKRRLWLAVQMKAKAYEEIMSQKEGPFRKILEVNPRDPSYQLEYWIFDKVTIREKTEENFKSSFISGRLLALSEMSLQNPKWQEGTRLTKLKEWLNINNKFKTSDVLRAAVVQEWEKSQSSPLYNFEKSGFLEFKKGLLRNSGISESALERLLPELTGLIESAFPEIYKEGVESALNNLAVNEGLPGEKLEQVLKIREAISSDIELSSILQQETEEATATEFYNLEKNNYKDDKIREFEDKDYIATEEMINNLKKVDPQEAGRLEEQRKIVITQIEAAFPDLFNKGKLFSLSKFAEKKNWEGQEVRILKELFGYKKKVAQILQNQGQTEVKIEDTLYAMAFEEFLIQKALDKGIDLSTEKGKQELDTLRNKYLQAYKDVYVDGVKSAWAEIMYRKVKARMEEKKEMQITAEGEVLNLLDKTFANYKVLKDSGMVTQYPDFFKPRPDNPQRHMSYEEFILDKKLDKGEEFVNREEVKKIYDAYFGDFFAETNLLFWAESLAKEEKLLSTDPRDPNLVSLTTFFSKKPEVENRLLQEKNKHEVELKASGREMLLEKILEEKAKEKGLTRQQLDDLGYTQLYRKHLEAINLNGVASFWTKYMLTKNKTPEELDVFFAKRKRALPLLRTYIDQEIDLSAPFISGIVTIIAENLENRDFKVSQAIDRDFILAYLTDSQARKFIEHLQKEIAELPALSALLKQVVDVETNPVHSGFVGYLTNFAWRLIEDKKVADEKEALGMISDKLSNLQRIMLSAGIDTPEEIEGVIIDPVQMGRWSYFERVVASTPFTERKKQDNLRLLNEFVNNYNNMNMGNTPEDLKHVFGEKVKWSREQWQVFKAHLEEFLGRKLLRSNARIKRGPSSSGYSGEVGRFIESIRQELGEKELLNVGLFAKHMLGESGIDSDNAFVSLLDMDKELLHRWAVILETFVGKSNSVEELEKNWDILVRRMIGISERFRNEKVEVNGQLVPLMDAYLREKFNIAYSWQTGILAWMGERVFSKALSWLHQAKYGDLEPASPQYLNPDWVLRAETRLVEEEIKSAIELRPYVEAAHLMRIDSNNHTYAGVLWFYVNGFMVNGLKDNPFVLDGVEVKGRPYETYPAGAGFFVSKRALKQQLKNQATLFVDLLTNVAGKGAAKITFYIGNRKEMIESYFWTYNALNPEFTGVLSYFAQEHIFNCIQGSGCGDPDNWWLQFVGPRPEDKPMIMNKPSSLAILTPYFSQIFVEQIKAILGLNPESKVGLYVSQENSTEIEIVEWVEKKGADPYRKEEERRVRGVFEMLDLLNAIEAWKGWDWSAFYGWKTPEGKVEGGTPAGFEVTADAPKGKYGYILNQTLLAQMQVTLKLAQQIKEDVEGSLGAKKGGLTELEQYVDAQGRTKFRIKNADYWKVWMQRANEVYQNAEKTAWQWESEGRIPTMRYWTPDLAELEDDISPVTALIFENGLNYKRTIFNQLPLRSNFLKTASWLLPKWQDKWTLQDLILPYLKKQEGEISLSNALDAHILDNYLGIALSLGRDIVYTNYAGEIQKLGEEEVRKRYGAQVLNQAELLTRYKDEIVPLGKEAVFKKYYDEAFESGVKALVKLLDPKADPAKLVIPKEEIKNRDEFIRNKVEAYLQNNIHYSVAPTQLYNDTLDYWGEVYDELVSIFQERGYFQAERYVQEVFTGNPAKGVRGILDELLLVAGGQQAFFMEKDKDGNFITSKQGVAGYAKFNKYMVQNWVKSVLSGLGFQGEDLKVAFREANKFWGEDRQPNVPRIIDTTLISASSLPDGGVRMSWTPIIDSTGKWVNSYEWQILDSQNNLISEGETDGLAYDIKGSDFKKDYIFRVRGVVKRHGVKIAEGPWAAYGFKGAPAGQTTPPTPPAPPPPTTPPAVQPPASGPLTILTIPEKPEIVAGSLFDMGIGWNINWYPVNTTLKIKDAWGNEIPVEYEWQLFDASGKEVKATSGPNITSSTSALLPSWGPGYTFKLRAIIRKEGNIVAASEWTVVSAQATTLPVTQPQQQQPVQPPTQQPVQPQQQPVPATPPPPQQTTPPAPPTPSTTPPTPPVTIPPTYSQPPAPQWTPVSSTPQAAPVATEPPVVTPPRTRRGRATGGETYSPPPVTPPQPQRSNLPTQPTYEVESVGPRPPTRWTRLSQSAPASSGYYGSPTAVYSPQARQATRTNRSRYTPGFNSAVTTNRVSNSRPYYYGVNRINDYYRPSNYATISQSRYYGPYFNRISYGFRPGLLDEPPYLRYNSPAPIIPQTPTQSLRNYFLFLDSEPGVQGNLGNVELFLLW
jgi:hypothetical protein